MSVTKLPGQHFRLGILAIDGCMLSSIASASDSLRVAQKLAEIRHPGGTLRLESVVFGARGQNEVSTSTGLTLSGLAAPPDDLDVILLPGIMHGSPQELIERIKQLQPEIDLLRAQHLRGVTIAGSCSGSFLLAESGLLDGHRATCSWWLATAFRQRYPAVNLDAEAMVVEDGGMMTAGGASAIQAFMLKLIARAGGNELAQQTARMLLIDPERQSQSPYVTQALMERPRNSLSEKAEQFLKHELHHEISVSGLAEHCGTSERSLLRHFRAHHGVTPLEHIQHLRVERAKALLESTHLSFDEIVERCGYSDSASFRKLFKRATAMTPGDYRERYRLRPH
ncbi:MAG TPA: helix-turn-helix domain-containing protein [Arenimonas sp.]|uniref:GlxA family transcriptional regulator n=1 Tax=Arenimonas sp. TaxID=1872635 RepID=UPI002C475130|nr:helix-turn-helix domain-containing protein [Arenimonas sp.]HMB57552.1 helix-turn-helix domain-containing protein [Arenimonas sp.]